MESQKYRAEIEVAASRYGLDPTLVEAVVRKESSGLTHAYRYEPDFYRRYLASNPAYDGANPRRVAASYGLMQIMYPTARERGFTEAPEFLFVPVIGLDWGCNYLASLLRRFKGQLNLALAAYNGGPGNARAPLRPDLERYVASVIKHQSDVRSGK
jgi:soluble lytic murein transglycosylase-like protein